VNPPATNDATRVVLTVYVRDGNVQTLAGELCRVSAMLLKQTGLVPRGPTQVKDGAGECLAMMEAIDR
jgi:hypothetical protein